MSKLCPDCGKVKGDARSARCNSCAVKFKRGPNHHSWKGGLPSCIDCSKKLSRYGYTRCSSCSSKGNLNGMYGKKLTDDQKRKISRSQVGMPHPWRQKENSEWWKGGITPVNMQIRQSIEYKLWRKSVFERDGYKCVLCGKARNLQADHIKPFALFPELRFAIDNGRTLCIDCHHQTETWGNARIYRERIVI